ncbi:MAG: YadA-like family protein, partial [Acidaminococcaceae bacterium]|nr:YadA-like family protein [Acidaminococcaceae bacterium]
NTVSVGTPNGERRIVNVAKAVTDTDAVNLAQVNDLLGTSGTGREFRDLQRDVAGIHNQIDRMGTRINKVGAGAAALAAMHPVYDEDCKLTFSAGLGAYRSEKAAAVGMFYRFSDRVMMNAGTAVGNDNNMFNIGLNFALDRHVGTKLPSKAVMVRQLTAQNEKINILTAENQSMKNKMAEQDAKIAKLMALLEEIAKKKG